VTAFRVISQNENTAVFEAKLSATSRPDKSNVK